MIKFLPVPKKFIKYNTLIGDIKEICRKYEIRFGLESWHIDIDWQDLESDGAAISVSPEYFQAAITFDPKAISGSSSTPESYVRHEFCHIYGWPLRELVIDLAGKNKAMRKLARKIEERVASDWERAPFWSRI